MHAMLYVENICKKIIKLNINAAFFMQRSESFIRFFMIFYLNKNITNSIKQKSCETFIVPFKIIKVAKI